MAKAMEELEFAGLVAAKTQCVRGEGREARKSNVGKFPKSRSKARRCEGSEWPTGGGVCILL